MAGRIVADDLEAIKALAVLGEGIAWLPDFLAADAVEAGSLVSVLPNWKSKPAGSFSFVYAGRKYTSPKVQAFIQVAQEIVASECQGKARGSVDISDRRRGRLIRPRGEAALPTEN